MSSLRGGAAAKAGDRYEALWGVRGMLSLLSGEAVSMRVEEPRVDGAEFYLERPEGREYWQVKRQLIGQKSWSLRGLSTEGVLGFFLEQARAGNCCVFASITDAPELRTLAQRARDALGFEEFASKFLQEKVWTNAFRELCRAWDGCAESEAFEVLQRIHVRVQDDITLPEDLRDILGVLFIGPGALTLDALRSLYETSVHQILTADSIRSHLAGRKVYPRVVTIEPSLLDRIRSITESYLEGQRLKLIRRELISRALAQSVISSITTGAEGQDFLITGDAGSGKSGCLFEIVDALRERGVPVLAFRLDRLKPAASAAEIGTELNLPDSPAVVLSRAFPSQKVVLAIDQLDFVSATSGRHPDFFDAVAALISEVRGLRQTNEVHLILTCRQFDFEHDARFRALLRKDQNPLKLGPLNEAEVRDVLAKEGAGSIEITASQLKLLVLPQNLALFIDSGLVQQHRPSFVSQKDLFDAYWAAKRSALATEWQDGGKEWQPIIETLTDAMTGAQELSVPKAVLDRFSPQFLSAMVSSGVLSFDDKRYGFGHESFFDYCFARTFTASRQDLNNYLANDPQHLFRRAQVRQVLVYLRDDDPGTYIKSISALLNSSRIRPHLKLLTAELIAAFPDPRDEEWATLLPFIQSELEAIRSRTPNHNKIASRIFDVFRASWKLFIAADRAGFVERWLASEDDAVANIAVTYLRWQLNEHGDRIAELIEPYLKAGGEWPLRLRFLMEGHSLEKSRRYFDLFLRVLDEGFLDEARDRFAVNGTFWSMLYSLAKERPAWCAEVAAHWLDRQVACALAQKEDDKLIHVSMYDDSGVNHLFESARTAPQEFLREVIPAIVRAAEATSYKVDETDGELPRDAIWSYRITGEYIGLDSAYLDASEAAFERLSQTDPEKLRPYIDILLSSHTYTANSLLLSAYLAAPQLFADDAMRLFCDDPDRLHCGYTDSGYWISKCLIEQCASHCTAESLERLQQVLAVYTPAYERSEERAQIRGRASFTLLSALPLDRCTASTRELVASLASRFGQPDGAPRGIRCYTVVSPISESEATDMSDDEWLDAIAKYNSSEHRRDWEHPEIGGAQELAAMMQDFVKREPERFAKLALRFPEEIEPAYLMHVLYGLKEAAIPGPLKIDVVRRVIAFSETGCLVAALDVLGKIDDDFLPADALDFVRRCAINHPDPDAELWRPQKEGDVAYYGGDILTCGINTVRGRAAETIRDLIFRDKRYLETFDAAVKHLVQDKIISVRACAASTLLAVAVHDTERAISLFRELVATDDLILATHFVADFIRRGLSRYLPSLRDHVIRMLGSKENKVREVGGRLASLAYLSRRDAEDLLKTAMNADASSRLGIAEIAEHNMTNATCGEACQRLLESLFNDEDSAVKQAAAKCFWHLWQKPQIPLADYQELISRFIDSSAFVESPTYLLHTLEDSRRQLPEVVLDVCEHFVRRCADLARDVRTHHAADEYTLGPLVFRAYQQLDRTPGQLRALNLIDQMCEEGLTSAAKHLAEFER